jgi:hypothetical protein
MTCLLLAYHWHWLNDLLTIGLPLALAYQYLILAFICLPLHNLLNIGLIYLLINSLSKK